MLNETTSTDWQAWRKAGTSEFRLVAVHVAAQVSCDNHMIFNYRPFIRPNTVVAPAGISDWPMAIQTEPRKHYRRLENSYDVLKESTMIKCTTFLILLVGLTLVACVSGERSETLLTPNDSPPSSVAVQGETPALNSLAESTPTNIVAPQIIVETDRGQYRQGESVVVTVENNSNNPIQILAICSLNLCVESGKDWICEERECDGPLTVLEPGSHLEVLQEAKSIGLAAASDTTSRYKLDYQIVSEDPFYFAHSNEFAVQSEGMNCEEARQIALEHAQSSPYWKRIDATRATVRWQGENLTCMVDFSWKSADQIRTGLWTEGYYVILSARSGQVIEANAYER
jgi:hypothetical protein